MKRNTQFFKAYRQTKRCYLLAIVACAFAACNKSNDSGSNPQPASIIGTWKITAATSDRDVPSQATQTMTKDLWLETDGCVKDNLLTFQGSSTIVQDEGATKCSASAPQTRTGTYSYQGTTLQLNDETYTVLQLDNTTLKITKPTKYYFINTSQHYDSTNIVITVTQTRQ